jgi:hypothetical protein
MEMGTYLDVMMVRRYPYRGYFGDILTKLLTFWKYFAQMLLLGINTQKKSHIWVKRDVIWVTSGPSVTFVLVCGLRWT